MKKEHLQEYRHICNELKRLNEKHAAWMARAERSTRSPSKAPTLRGQHDPMPMIVDKLTALRGAADGLIKRLTEAQARIERAIEKLPSVQRQVMRARYIDGMCWEDISVRMAYSREHLHRIHKKALEFIKDDTP